MPAALIAPAARLLVRVVVAAVLASILLAAVITAATVVRVTWDAIGAAVVCPVVSSEPARCTDPERINR